MPLPLKSALAAYQTSRKTISRDQWKNLFFTYLFFTLFSAAVLSPVFSFLIQAAVSLSGESALTDTEIATYLLTPAGAVIGVIMLSLALALGFFTYSAILISLTDESANVAQILNQLAARLSTILRLTARFTFSIILTILPFAAAIGAIYFYFISDNDINYYLAERPPEFIKAVALTAIVVLTLGFTLIKLATSWFLALPHTLFSDCTSKEAATFSKFSTLGRKKEIAACVGVWLFGTPLLATILTLPFNFLTSWLVPQLADRLPLLALTLGGNVALTTLITFCVAFSCFCLFAHRNLQIYQNVKSIEAAPLKKRATKTQFELSNKILIPITIAGLLISGFICYRWIDKMPMDDDIIIIAHRGSSLDAPENTLAAIQKAVTDGADWVEIDVQETADGEVVVFHDSDFKRVGGKKLNIWDAQSSELPNIEIGSWFSQEFKDQTTPSLSAVLELCKDKSGVLIELKYYGHDVNLEQKVVDLVESHGMEDQVMIMSLKYEGVQKVRKLRPEWKVGLLSTIALGDITKLDVDFLGLNSRTATPKLIKRAHESDIDIFVWTVNEPLDISAMTSRGVDGIITDTPSTAFRVIDQRSELQKGQRLLLELAHAFGRKTNNLIQ